MFDALVLAWVELFTVPALGVLVGLFGIRLLLELR